MKSDKSRPPVITHVAGWPSMQNGSFERQLVVLGKTLAEAGAQLHLVFQDYPKSDAFVADAAPIHVMPPAKGAFDVGYVRRCAALMRSLGTTHLHAHFGTDAYLAVAAARMAGIDRRFATKHITPGRSRLTASRLRHQLLASQVDVMFAVSSHVRNGLIDLGVPESKVQVNHIGIDFQRYRRDDAQRAKVRSELGLNTDDTLVLVTSHLRAGKGVELMPEVATALRPRQGRCLVAVAGEGPKRAEIEALAAEHAVGPDRFRLLGRRDDIPALLAAADIFMLPTNGRFEGLPMSVLEALACGAPGIVTDVSGLRSEIGAFATVVAPGSAQALFEAAQQLLDQPDMAARMAAAAQPSIRANYAVEKGVSELVSAYLG